MPALFNTIVLLHIWGKDSLAQRLLHRFDPWMKWNPYWVASLPFLMQRLSRDPRPAMQEINDILEQSPTHWSATVLKQYISYYQEQGYWQWEDSTTLDSIAIKKALQKTSTRQPKAVRQKKPAAKQPRLRTK